MNHFLYTLFIIKSFLIQVLISLDRCMGKCFHNPDQEVSDGRWKERHSADYEGCSERK